MIRILTDSASDILPAEAEQLGVTVIPSGRHRHDPQRLL